MRIPEGDRAIRGPRVRPTAVRYRPATDPELMNVARGQRMQRSWPWRGPAPAPRQMVVVMSGVATSSCRYQLHERCPATEHMRLATEHMRHYPDRPVVSVGAVVVDGYRVLLVKRGQEPL